MCKWKSLTELIQSYNNVNDRGVTFIKGEDDETYYSYSQIYKDALAVLHYIQDKGMKPGDELVFQFDDNEKFICTFWACILGGIVPVPVTVGNNWIRYVYSLPPKKQEF